ncbi:FAD-dependent oxidoreductase [Dietzia sp.]|uniref:FAD-dependent oxidoreductase n=1 Tax=Dietzia sp. TaxID=1871616 RepID=UPI002FD8E229
MLGPIASDLVVLTEGEGVPDSLCGNGNEFVEASVEEVREDDGGLTIVTSDGADTEVAGLFLVSQMRQHAPFVAELGRELGLEITEAGFVSIDERGRTSVAGIYVAGDMAVGPNLPMPMSSVGNAIGGGRDERRRCAHAPLGAPRANPLRLEQQLPVRLAGLEPRERGPGLGQREALGDLRPNRA